LDLVEVDPGWEEAFEAAAGASLAAVVVSGSGPARAALARLRQGEATGAVLALTGAVEPAAGGRGTDHAIPATEPVRRHVSPRRGRPDIAGLAAVLDTLLAGSVCANGGWTDAIDLALARPDLVVVTREGDRFSSTGWRVRAGGGVVTAAVVEEAQARADVASEEAARAAEARRDARATVEATRAAAAEAVRADDRNEGAHQTARVARSRIANDLTTLASEIEEIDQSYTELDERIGRDAARAAELDDEVPRLEGVRAGLAERLEAAQEERQRIDDRIAEGVARRTEWEVRWAGLEERRRVLADRHADVERRLTGHSDERQQAAERRRRLESDATAAERLLAVVGTAQLGLDAALAELRERHRRQREVVRAGGARLETLRGQRSAAEHELAAVRSRIQKIELELAESGIRREAVVDMWRRELGSKPDEALAAPAPELPDGVDAEARVEQLELELAKLGPVNP
ncbi:MAG: hypothetical protein ACRDWB_04255, partial [Acidimicrobiales bacterium]